MTIFADAVAGLRPHGIALIPLRAGLKTPLIGWGEYQTRQPTLAELARWSGFKDANAAMVTGPISRVVLLDIDDMVAAEAIESTYFPKGWTTPVVRTPRGIHIWFRSPGFPVPNSSNRALQVDFRGHGGYAVVPPSTSGTGDWTWLASIEDYEPDPLPAWAIGLFPALAEQFA